MTSVGRGDADANPIVPTLLFVYKPAHAVGYDRLDAAPDLRHGVGRGTIAS